ncbi:hypothetical protein IscW_ISCW021348 [Ixodes scapularis]|uniref:Uncharacterized protein n=1 Tax=Ixodes scapularis TaxID=6945 RepID=B7Q571_IXOSC|nr:hypothetical protein IscW_ISCW021348 [Ixodes scapularis]|eukprot:XP_002411700.1 hypothetical protein IscW_ISCW021348 [Ixodes scapularis]
MSLVKLFEKKWHFFLLTCEFLYIGVTVISIKIKVLHPQVLDRFPLLNQWAFLGSSLWSATKLQRRALWGQSDVCSVLVRSIHPEKASLASESAEHGESRANTSQVDTCPVLLLSCFLCNLKLQKLLNQHEPRRIARVRQKGNCRRFMFGMV